MAPKLCRAVDLVKSLGLSNKEEANKHLYALKERGLVQVVNEEQGGNPLWKCNSVKMQGASAVYNHNCKHLAVVLCFYVFRNWNQNFYF